MDNQRLTDLYKVITNYWQFIKSHSEPNFTDGYWDEIFEAVKTFIEESKKYTSEEFARGLALAYLNEAERIAHKEMVVNGYV